LLLRGIIVAQRRRSPTRSLAFLFAGFMDASGGGGWGPVGTPALLASGRIEPRRVIGGVIAAPIAAYLVRHIPPRLLGSLVGGMIVLTNARSLLRGDWIDASPSTQWLFYAPIILVWPSPTGAPSTSTARIVHTSQRMPWQRRSVPCRCATAS
jgi:uncharacterized membrane protein YfcA